MGWLKGESLLPIWLVSIGASIVGAGQASACSCIGPSADSIIEKADIAFEGEVIEAVDFGLVRSCIIDGLGRHRARDLLFSCDRGSRIRVLTPLKGQPGGIVTVYTPHHFCGYGFKKGERLKVVAWYKRGHRLSTDSCAIFDANH